jgi:hypothetical protein
MVSIEGKMNMHFEAIANNQSCNAVLRARITRHAGTRRIVVARNHNSRALQSPPLKPHNIHPQRPHLASPQTRHLAPPPFPAPPALKRTRPDTPPLAPTTPQATLPERRRNKDCGMPKRDYATRQTEQHDARSKEPTRNLIRGVGEKRGSLLLPLNAYKHTIH